MAHGDTMSKSKNGKKKSKKDEDWEKSHGLLGFEGLYDDKKYLWLK